MSGPSEWKLEHSNLYLYQDSNIKTSKYKTFFLVQNIQVLTENIEGVSISTVITNDSGSLFLPLYERGGEREEYF